MTLGLGIWTSADGTNFGRFGGNTLSTTAANQIRGVTLTQSGGIRSLGASTFYAGLWVSYTTTAPEILGLSMAAGTTPPILGQLSTASVMPIAAAKLTGQATFPNSFVKSALLVPDFVPYIALHPTAQ